MTTKKTIKVRDLKPAKDAKGGGKGVSGTHTSGTGTSGVGTSGTGTSGKGTHGGHHGQH